MATADWTYWDWAGSGDTIMPNVVRYNGLIWYYSDALQLRVLDEDVLGGSSLMATVPSVAPTDALSYSGWRMFRFQQYLFCCVAVTRLGWGEHLVIYRYDTTTDTYITVLDPYTGVGWSHSFTSVQGTSIVLNSVGFIIGTLVPGDPGTVPLVLCSYNGVNWFIGDHDPDLNILFTPSVVGTDYKAIVSQASYKRWCTTDLTVWSDTVYAPPSLTPISNYGSDKLWYGHPTNSDLWVYTDNLFASYHPWRTDVGLTTLRQLNAGGGLYWTCANQGLAYWVPDTNVWQLDYPNTPTSDMNIHWLEEGYTGSLFFFSYLYAGGISSRIYKRTTKPGGSATAVGLGSNKLSIDRDSSAVYCTTYGVDTLTTDYWRVESDLSDVTLIDKSEVSGVYGGVHSAEAAGVYCYGKIYGDLVHRSLDRGDTFSGWAIPSGLVSSLEASTLYTKRDNSLPDNVVVTITTSGLAQDLVYGHPSGAWVYKSNASMIAESQVRRDEHTFIGALVPSGNIVDYSADEGLTWESRDTPLPTITITDLEFA